MSLCLNKSYLWQNINQKHHIMITFPNAKINLGLNVVEKRADGYHNIETVFYPINLQDALEVNRLENRNEPFRLYVKGTLLDGAPEDNLVVKAYLCFARNTSCLLSTSIYTNISLPEPD